MYRENDFQRNIKWFVIGAAGLCSICQIILLFYEFSFYSGIGMLINGLYHLIAIASPGLIIYLYLKDIDDKEIYTNYLLALHIGFGSFVDICLVVKHIMLLKETEGFSVALIVMGIILILLDLFCALCFIRYGLDKITCVVPLLISFIVLIYRGALYNSFDSKFSTYAYNYVSKSIFTIWGFMHIFLIMVLIVCLVLYADLQVLQDLIRNPKELFTKNTFYGTHTNLYLNEQKPKDIQTGNDSASQIQVPTMQNNVGVQLIGLCPDCGNQVFAGQNCCMKCGCPVLYVNANNTYNSNEVSNSVNNIGRVCPDCGSSVSESVSACPNCGCLL